MIQSIEQYLSLLKKELSGCDRATIQDALADAEEHLRTALSNVTVNDTVSKSEALSRIIEKYGTPEEVAAAYRESEGRLTPVLSQTRSLDQPDKRDRAGKRSFLSRFFGVFIDPGAWGATIYLLLSLLTGIIYFSWAVTGLSLSASLIVLIIGLPFIGLFILSIRGIGLVEGLMVEALLGIRMPRRSPFYQRDMGLWARFKMILKERHTWLSLVYMILQLPLGIIYFTVFITLIALSLSGIAIPILQLGFDIPVSYVNGVSYYLDIWVMPFVVIAGIILATLTMHLAKYVGRLHGMMAKVLLVRV